MWASGLRHIIRSGHAVRSKGTLEYYFLKCLLPRLSLHMSTSANMPASENTSEMHGHSQTHTTTADPHEGMLGLRVAAEPGRPARKDHDIFGKVGASAASTFLATKAHCTDTFSLDPQVTSKINNPSSQIQPLLLRRQQPPPVQPDPTGPAQSRPPGHLQGSSLQRCLIYHLLSAVRC